MKPFRLNHVDYQLFVVIDLIRHDIVDATIIARLLLPVISLSEKY